MDQAQAERVARKLIAFLESGEAEPTLFTDDAFCDFTSPRWRVQAEGRAQVLQLRAQGHPSVGKVTRSRCDPTPNGFVLEVEEEWLQGGKAWYCRELFRADVRAGSIASLSVYCTGDWDAARRAEHAREVCLLRP